MGMALISNKRLDRARIPDPDGDWRDWHLFAHTINGYKKAGSFEACATLANQHSAVTAVACRKWSQR